MTQIECLIRMNGMNEWTHLTLCRSTNSNHKCERANYSNHLTRKPKYSRQWIRLFIQIRSFDVRAGVSVCVAIDNVHAILFESYHEPHLHRWMFAPIFKIQIVISWIRIRHKLNVSKSFDREWLNLALCWMNWDASALQRLNDRRMPSVWMRQWSWFDDVDVDPMIQSDAHSIWIVRKPRRARAIRSHVIPFRNF